MKKRRVILLPIFTIFFAFPSFSASDTSAKKIVEEYVQKQFDADKDDMLQDEYAKYTKLTPALEEHVVDGVLYDFRHDPYVVVSSYKILEVKLDEHRGRGTARVEYERIGRGEIYRSKNSPWTKLFIEPDVKEVVILALTFDGMKWLIKDPGLPHISCSAIKRIYSEYQEERKKSAERFANVLLEAQESTPKNDEYGDTIIANYSAIDSLSCK